MDDDLIYRQAAIDALDCINGTEEVLRSLPSAQPEKVCIAKITLSEEQVREAVEKAKSEIVQVFPSAQPERKTGHWIFCDESCKCSICGEDPMNFVETTGFNSALMDREYPMQFCPNCGAKMEVENEI